MQNPEKQLNDYLEKITDEVLLLNENLRALKNIIEELRKDEYEEIRRIYWYLSRSLYDLLFDNLVLNLSWLFDKYGERSLIWFLTQMKKQSDTYFKSLAEKRVNYEPRYFLDEQSIDVYKTMKNQFPVRKNERKCKIKETSDKYRRKIDEHLNEIKSVEINYLKLKDVRDKSIAHRDKQVFDNPSTFWEEAKLTIEDIEILTNLATNIVKDMYTVMRNSTLELVPSAHIGTASLFGRLKEYREMEKRYHQLEHKLWLLDKT